MAKPDIWMPMYWADLIADTLHLNRSDFGSYMLLIGAYWRKGGPLPDDNDALRMISRCPETDWMRVRGVLETFFQIHDQRWHHKRIDLELKAAADNQEAQRRRTAAATAARKNVTDNVTTNVTTPVTFTPSPSPSPSPVQSSAKSTQPTNQGQQGSNFPTLDQVKVVASMRGIPEPEAERFWNHFESSGWIDKNGHPIVRWEPKLLTWCADSRARPAEAAHHAKDNGHKSIHELRVIIEQKEKIAQTIKNDNCTEGPLDNHWSFPEKRREYINLCREIKDLRTRISKMA